MKKYSLNFVAVTTISLAQAGQAWACAVCLSGGADGAADGYNASVLFLMSTPYLVFGAIIGGMVLTYRRAQKRRQALDAEATMGLAWKQEESGR